jgi:exodeoxyribonuclease VII large subunit
MNWENVVINGHEVSVAFDDEGIHVYNSYPVKDDLKIRGYRWNPDDKSWYLRPGDVAAEMAALKNNLQTSAAPSAPSVPAVPPDIPGELAQFPQSYTVADLRNRIDRLIREGIRGNIWIRGVIASEVKHYDWASYLDLRDEDENRKMFFRVEVKKKSRQLIQRKLSDSGVAGDLEKDLPVFCNVEVYLPFQNVVDVRLSLLDILPEYTQSKIRNQREITLDTLNREGILENQKQLLLPALVSRIGLITSGQGTSVKDIKAGLHPYEDRYQFYFVDSRMEGAHAVDSIIRAISYLEHDGGIPLDAIVIARGGGSEQSLAVFNDLRLCRRVCQARIPILTAIGHEKDVSAIELCSCLTPTPSTPSGIGKFLQNRFRYLQDQLAGTMTQLIHRFTTIHHREMEKIRAFLKHIPARAAGRVAVLEERFFTLTRGLERSMSFTVRDHERRVRTLSAQLVRRGRELRLKNRDAVHALAVAMLARSHTLNRREQKEVEKTISRLDFSKRRRDNRKLLEDIRKHAQQLLRNALKTLGDTEKDLQARRFLAQANDPQKILEKGFTLTLDEQQRVIKSLEAFRKLDTTGATLRFFDGAATIIKKEETSS